MIIITIEITPGCKHEQFDENCSTCQSARQKARALMQKANQFDGVGVKVEITKYEDTTIQGKG